MQYGIVILNRYPQLAKDLLSSIRRHHKFLPSVVVVCDRHHKNFEGVDQIHTEDDFVFARNANRGIKHFPDKDIVLLNDDMECVMDDFFPKLRRAAYRYPSCGIMSPLIDGGVGNEMQQYPAIADWSILPNEVGIAGIDAESMPVCFPCVYIKRKMIEHVGLLDENFTGYGLEDNDYCIRARRLGALTMITRALRIKHGSGGISLLRGENWSISFAKEPERNSNLPYFIQKHSPKK